MPFRLTRANGASRWRSTPFRRGSIRGATSSASAAESMSSTAVASPAAGLGSARDVWRSRGALAVMTASGFAGLGYQIVWTQQAALWLGHESAAVLAVITAFFGGLALGSFAFGPRIERSTQPVRWYAACEGVIAMWGVALALAMPTVSEGLLVLIGTQPSP